jgi:hypothetical protein
VQLRAQLGIRGPGAQQRLAEQVPIVPMISDALTLVASSSVRGVRSGAQPDGVFWNAAEWSRAQS